MKTQLRASLNFEQLTNRDTPSVAVVTGNDLFVLDETTGAVLKELSDVVEESASNVPFQVASTSDGHSVVLGAGAGGGPRALRVDLDTGAVEWSVFVGDPSTRNGVGVADVADFTGPPEQHSGSGITIGDGYTVFLDVEDGSDADSLVRQVYGYFAPAGNVAVTDVRPNADPTTYATVTVGGSLTWASSLVGGGAIAGIAEFGTIGTELPNFRGPSAYAKGSLAPTLLPKVVAHEAGHLFGLPHVEGDAHNLMNPFTQIGVTQTFDSTQIAHIAGAANAGLGR